MRYIVQGPDGRKYIVEGPGAAPAQVPAPAPQAAPVAAEPALEGNVAPAPGAQPTQQTSDQYLAELEQTKRPQREGMIDSLIKGGIGLKQLVGLGSEDDQYALKGIKQAEEEETDTAGRLKGNVFGGLLTAAIPGVGTRVGGKSLGSAAFRAGEAALSRAPQFLKSVLGGASAAGATGLVLNPGEGATTGEQIANRVEKSGKDAAAGGVLSGAAHAARKVATGIFTPNDEARMLYEQGINPTLQQGASSKTARFIGGLASGAEKVSARQNDEGIAAYVRKYVEPNLDTSGMRPDEIVGLLKNKFHGDGTNPGEFEKILGGKRYLLTPSMRNHLWALAGRGDQRTAEAGLAAMGSLGAPVHAKVPIRLGYKGLRQLRDDLQYQIKLLKGSQDPVNQRAGDNIIKVKDSIDRLVRDPALSQSERDAFYKLQEQYRYFKRLDEAASNAEMHRNPRIYDLEKSFAKQDKRIGAGKFSSAEDPALSDLLMPAVRTMGLTPSQDASRTALQNIRRMAGPALQTAGLTAGLGAVGGLPAAAAMAPVYATSLLGQSAKGARGLFGQNRLQKKMLEYLRKNPQLREEVGRTGFALTPDTEE